MKPGTLIIDATTTSTIAVLNSGDEGLVNMFLQKMLPHSGIELTGPITVKGGNSSDSKD
jgi:hypothetical protein